MSSGGHDSHIPLKTYFNILVALLILTVVTVAAARVDFGAFNTIIALGIASAKAFLVLGWFMHLKFDDKIYWVMFGTSIFGLVLLYFFSVLDIYTRIMQISPL